LVPKDAHSQVTNTEPGRDADTAMPVLPLRKGLWVAVLLSMIYLAGTAYVSVVTLLDRVQSTDVMKAVSGDIWSLRIAGQMAYFIGALLGVHLVLAVLAWLLARASAEFSREAREKFVLVVIGWFSLLGGAALAFNALWFPRTFFGAHYYDSMVATVGPFHAGQVIYATVCGLAIANALAGGVHWLRRQHPQRRRRRLLATFAVAVAALMVMASPWQLFRSGPTLDPARPNVILLGVDSLRLDELARFGSTRGNTPHIDSFLRDADIVKDASTPMARTFGSWVAILTSRAPRATGARNNLTPREMVKSEPTIGDVLRTNGYHTVYSTDEVRFANIDESYGFDQVITPPIGASDFIIGTYNELPLASVVINTRLGQYLFPFSFGNRGAAVMFEPKTYVGRLKRELRFDRPTFLVVHLTAAHWPYYTAETPFGVSKPKSPEDRPIYRIGLRTADSMFDQVVHILGSKGALDNAIVVVLSDHGEAMLLPNDAIVKNGAFVKGLGAPMKVLDVGHGQSVLSQTQYKVLLSFKAFGERKPFHNSGRDIPVPATVEDISRTLLDLLGVPGNPLQSEALSLAPWLQATGMLPAGPETSRVRYTETDLAVIPDVRGEVDEVETAKQNSKFFGIDSRTTRMHIWPKMMPLVRAFKERAAFTQQHLLAAMPAGPETHQYVYFDIATGNGELLLERPGPELPEGQLLWDSLHSHFEDELKPPTRTTIDQWPQIAIEWRDYFINKQDAPAASAPGPAPTPAAEPGSVPTSGLVVAPAAKSD
jgi:hypothetical protein